MADSVDPYAQTGRSLGLTNLETATPKGGSVDITEKGDVSLNDPEEESAEVGSHFDNLAETLDHAELSNSPPTSSTPSRSTRRRTRSATSSTRRASAAPA